MPDPNEITAEDLHDAADAIRHEAPPFTDAIREFIAGSTWSTEEGEEVTQQLDPLSLALGIGIGWKVAGGDPP